MAHTTSSLTVGSMAQMKLSSQIHFCHLIGNLKVGPQGLSVPLSHPITSINKACVLATWARLTIKGSDAVSLFEFVCIRVGHICPSESLKPVSGGRADPLTYGTWQRRRNFTDEKFLSVNYVYSHTKIYSGCDKVTSCHRRGSSTDTHAHTYIWFTRVCGVVWQLTPGTECKQNQGDGDLFQQADGSGCSSG